MHIRSTTARSLVAVPTAAALMLLAPVAHAAAGGNGNGKGHPGNNGTVKIHDAATGQEDVRNEPKVCTFYLDSFGFDPNQDVLWAIFDMDDMTEPVVYGDLPVDDKGHIRTEDINLPDGHYKLFWKAVPLVDGELPEHPDVSNPKQKVFKVDCGGQTPSPTGKPTATGTPTKAPSAGPTAVPSTTPSHTPAPSHTPTPSQTPAPSHSATPPATPTPTVPAPTAPAPTTPATEPAKTPAPTTPAAEVPTGAPSDAPSAGPSTPPTATVPVHPGAGTKVTPDQPLVVPAKVSVPTPIPGASDGKKLASTGSDGTLLYAGAGTALLVAGAGAVVYTRRRRTSS
ncbi:LPXTG cell wall anchor domain-containing protein [Kitasatospora aureofaciens]|uniref:LPXTG cell wall anchor domain-containing protein n=1 Tax=Kitasatospora aureofaciens TaxID=1894 RepID=UPI002430F194|nr:LPXTG cell wall anchor domain-containing protein [Kitasatospora aureofaciens]